MVKLTNINMGDQMVKLTDISMRDQDGQEHKIVAYEIRQIIVNVKLVFITRAIVDMFGRTCDKQDKSGEALGYALTTAVCSM